MINKYQDSQQLEDVFNCAAIGIARVALDGKWLSVNPQFCDIVGYSREELTKLTFRDFTHPDDLEQDFDLLDQFIRGERKTNRMEKRLFRKNGEIVWINKTNSMVCDKKNNPKYFISIIEDITQHKNIQLELKKEKVFTERTINSSLAGIYIFNLSSGVNEFINNTYTDITGYTIDDLNQMSAEQFARLFHEEERDAVFKHIAKVTNTSNDSFFEIEYRFRKKDGDWVWCLSRDRAFNWTKEHRVESFIGTFMDITASKKNQTELDRLSRIDYLTGLSNRKNFSQTVNREFKRCKRYNRGLSIAMIDLDNFKLVNDQFGHQVGDDSLVLIADSVKASVREIDLAARYGGDEFIIMLAETTPEQALETVKRIQKNLQSQQKNKPNSPCITISIGIASLTDETVSVEQLIGLADSALLNNKKLGKNTIQVNKGQGL
jgi:diguanylate cyclase (GGDEF)-like protein/PAS domain S-box-containing protein